MNDLICHQVHLYWGCIQEKPDVVCGFLVLESVTTLGVGLAAVMPGDWSTAWDRLAHLSSAEITSRGGTCDNYLMHANCFTFPGQKQPTQHLGDHKGLGKKQMVGGFSLQAKKKKNHTNW